MIQIQENTLQELLENRKKHFKSQSTFIEATLSLISFICSLFIANISTCGIMQKIFISILILLYIVLFFFIIWGCRYSTDAFYNDIVSASKDIHAFSLIVIKNGNLYLLKYNKRWKCYLFPFLQTKENDDKSSAIEYIKNDLNIKNCNIEKIVSKNFTKHSVSANMTKTYQHTFYFLKNNQYEKQTFKLHGNKYKWFTIEQMKENKNIREKNNDNIDFVSKTF